MRSPPPPTAGNVHLSTKEAGQISTDISFSKVPHFAPFTSQLPSFTSRLHKPLPPPVPTASRSARARLQPSSLPIGPATARVCWETSLLRHGLLCKF